MPSETLAWLATRAMTDNANLRYCNFTADYAEIYVSEDTSYDPETAHGDEAVAYLAIEGSGLLHGSNVRKYYAAAGERVALRERDQLYWLLTDHLGSTITVLDSTGATAPGGEPARSFAPQAMI